MGEGSAAQQTNGKPGLIVQREASKGVETTKSRELIIAHQKGAATRRLGRGWGDV